MLDRAVRFVSGVASRLTGIGLWRTAAALSFTSVLGLVPLFTVAFVYVARYPLFESWLSSLEAFLLKHLLPGSGAAIRPYLIEFTTRAANLQGLGIMIVVLTAVMLLATIEREINVIFRNAAPRSLVRRAIVYGVGVTCGPLAIGAAVWSTHWLLEASLRAPFAKPAVALVAAPVAVALEALVFTVLYAVLPARRVPVRAAIAGGVFAALMFEAAKRGFVLYVTHVPTYERVYGTVAVLPLFLVWVYVSWIIVLFGAAVTATLAAGARSRRAT
jgi:membrane protein